MITLDLRAAITRAIAAAGLGNAAVDPKLRPGGPPGTYASSIAFGLAAVSAATESITTVGTDADTGADTGHARSEASTQRPVALAEALAGQLATEDWIAQVKVAGGGFITVTVTTRALAGVAARIAAAGPRCGGSDVLRGVTVPRPPRADLESAVTWEEARAGLAAELTARLSEAAGATGGVGGGVGRSRSVIGKGALTGVIAFAGRDAVRFALARAIPARPLQALDPAKVARNSLDNPAYAVRYAHARAASGVRWVAALQAAVPAQGEAAPCLPADPAELALLDALSWLPERVAIAARRGRPDEFARYLEELSRATIAASRFIDPANDERLALAHDLATAARTGLAAGLGLLGVTAPDRL